MRGRGLDYLLPAVVPYRAAGVYVSEDQELTHRAFGSDGHGLQEDLNDPGSDPRRVLVVRVQVVQDLLDHVVRVLSLSP